MPDVYDERLRAEREADRVRADERVAAIARSLGVGAEPRVGTAPVWGGVGRGLAQITTALATPASIVPHALSKGIEYATGLPSTDYITPNVEAFKRAWGVGGTTPVAETAVAPTVIPPVATTAPVSVAPATVTAPTASATPPSPEVAARRHPLAEKYANIYEALRVLSDAKFKRFVDGAGDSVPGIGYVETVDPKTGKPRMERVIENPADKTQEPMTLGEAEVASRILAGVGAREEAREARKDRNLLLEKQLGIKEEAGKEVIDLKKADAFYKRLDVLAPTVGVDEAGKPIKAHNVALLDMQDSGMKFREDAPDLYPAAQKLWDDRERSMRDAITSLKGGEYKAEDINKPGTKTYKYREILKKKYRDALIESYKPKL